MVDLQLVTRDIVDEPVLAAMRAVPRHRFVPPAYERLAYADHPIPLTHGATVSQPYIVALMTQLASIKPGDRVLEVGTGSGYQSAVLAALGAEVYSVEVTAELATQAASTLAELGLGVHVRHGDGYFGWPEHAPYAAILVTAAAPSLPRPLIDQLARGGRLVIPLGRGVQDLQVLARDASDRLRTASVLPVQFVPMTGEVAAKRDP